MADSTARLSPDMKYMLSYLDLQNPDCVERNVGNMQHLGRNAQSGSRWYVFFFVHVL